MSVSTQPGDDDVVVVPGCVRTLILCGFPNVGKSSLMNTLTRADVEVQPYAFTTKSLYVGHFDYRYLRWQIIDTPGILDQPLEQRNTIEMQAVTALAHLKATVLFMMDISEQCDHTLEEQYALFDSIRPLFANKPVMVGLNKVDITRRTELPAAKKALLSKIEADDIPVIELSTVTKEGVIPFRDTACDALMAQRVQRKLQAKGSDNSVISRLFVAVPEPRDDLVRAPFIPANALDRGSRKPKVADEDAMEVDPPKKFIVPEIWEGHNIADFFQQDIEAIFADLTSEERQRIAAGIYDADLDSDDEDTKKLLAIADRITAKEDMCRLNFRMKKATDGPRTSITVCHNL